MARASKKDHIIEQATGLFLEQGFKGTSIDLVVTTCGVSKPTVYKHFPDKTILIGAVMAHWLQGRVQPLASDWSLTDVWHHLCQHWWSPEPMHMYRLVISEGWRFPKAAEAFWTEFDAAWWAQADAWQAQQSDIEAAGLQLRLQAELWRQLVPQSVK
ncbi:MAG: TetR/AcrR family transcriptional regulator [Natronospirillum sp.]|uniref:TetR/AcrR family transcriptional regulator n=1 Tax=Natronospirillum sp. TaxID=2812955 RepID=UPI0025FD5267|nr:TetR/AcrR family transcriptional regulator [Natronospirillum sp.]MCH8551135.1 TetR/AcrR family transcriptional regulator [Natronospirillum sp.]